jgi:hypothetical protein
MVAARISIEDGAFFKGSIDIQKGGGDSHARPAAAPAKTDSHAAAESPKYAAVAMEAKKLN